MLGLEITESAIEKWEKDQNRPKVYPTWPHQPKLISYLGYDPFTDPALGSPGGNETYGVAFLSSDGSANLPQQIARYRVLMKKNRKQCAKELGISAKTLWGWETGRRKPSAFLSGRIAALLKQKTECRK